MNLAYAAGIIDGEGCIQFTRCRTSVYPRVLVTNTDIGLLEAFKDAFGGSITRLARRPGWKQAYQWCLQWTKAVKFLDSIVEFLLIKNRQCHTVFAWHSIRRRGGRETAEHLTALDLLTARMKWLNAKGPTVGEDPINAVLRRVRVLPEGDL